MSEYRTEEPSMKCLAEARMKVISLEARARYANIMMDTAFKLVFGTEANRDLLIELLNCLIPGMGIKSVTFKDKEIPGFFVDDKKTVFDLYCTTDKKETFVVEMQLHGQKYFTDRVLFYSTYPLREQVVTPLEEEQIRKKERKVRKRGTYRLKPVYMVSILDFELPHERADELREGLVSSYSLRSDCGGAAQMTDALHFVFLELPRLKVGRDEPEKCRTLLEKIAFAFRHISFLKERPESFSEEFFAHLFHAAELANMTSDERRKYDKEMTTEIDKRAQLSFVREQGRAEGIESTARKMLADGLDAATIAKYTGLSCKQINALKSM